MSARTALVTGASSGIGLACSRALSESGVHVIGVARKQPDSIEPFAAFIEADLSSHDGLLSTLRSGLRGCDPPAICVNAAGAASLNHFLTTPEATIDRLMAINYGGTAIAIKAVAPGMVRGRWGRIINISTAAVPYNLAGEAGYIASKAAVESLTRVLSHELGGFGITVNAIGPPPTPTKMISKVPDEKIAALVKRQAIQRLGTEEDVTAVLQFLVGDDAGFVTGQVIRLGGP